MKHEIFMQQFSYLMNVQNLMNQLREHLRDHIDENILDANVKLSEQYIENNKHFINYDCAKIMYYYTTKPHGTYDIQYYIFKIKILINSMWILEDLKINDFEII